MSIYFDSLEIASGWQEMGEDWLRLEVADVSARTQFLPRKTARRQVAVNGNLNNESRLWRSVEPLCSKVHEADLQLSYNT